MTTLPKLCLSFVALASVLTGQPAALVAGEAPGEVPGDVESLLRDELARLASELVDPEVSARLGQELGLEIEALVLRAEARLEAGDWLGALGPLAALLRALEPQLEFDAPPDLDALDERCRSFAMELARDPAPQLRNVETPAVQRAMWERAQASALDYLASAPLQGRETSLKAGIYYFRAAQSEGRLASFLSRLELPSEGVAYADVPGLEQLLAGLEDELLEHYRPPFAQEQHATFIGLSAGLKFARELQQIGFVHGSFQAGLEVKHELACFLAKHAGTALGQGERDRWNDALDEAALRFAELERDDSLAIALLKDARERLLASEEGALEAQVLLEDVLPTYLACFDENRKSQQKEPTSVTVTLVRWPFT